MSNRPFAHLHCHTHYSLLDGASRVPELVARVKEQGMNAVAITDHGNLYGAIEFYRECKDAGVNPVLYALPVIFTASCAFLLPLDAVPLVTYGKGYYRMFDMFLPGAVISVAWVVVLTGLLLALGPMLGLL